MLQNRLYYKNPYCQSFTANIIKSEIDKEGNYYVVLDNTAFYPTGGGQPYDTGKISNIQVVNVEEIDGEIRHFTEKELPLSTEVFCEINWPRRFDHMQQHSGQHILSAALVELFDMPTVSFHLGREIVSIDIAAEDLSNEELAQVEKRANEIILENHSIETKWVTENDLSNYPIRKDIQATGEIRLVIIPNFDYNGCGGTHPTSTGQVSMLKIMDVEKHRGHLRIYFVCGNRVLQQLKKKKTIVKEASQLLSAADEQITGAIQQALETNRLLEKQLKEKEENILDFEAKEIIQNPQPFIAKTFQNRSIQQLQKLARNIVQSLDDTIVFLVANNEDKVQFVAARGKSVDSSMKEIASIVLPRIKGKGGGSDAFVQGGGNQKLNLSELIEEVKKHV